MLMLFLLLSLGRFFFEGSHFGFHRFNLDLYMHKKAFCAYVVVFEVNLVISLNLGHTGEGMYVSYGILSNILIYELFGKCLVLLLFSLMEKSASWQVHSQGQ